MQCGHCLPCVIRRSSIHHAGFTKDAKYVNQNLQFVNKEKFNLGRWVSKRRKDYKKGILSQKKVKELESYKGWDWDPTNTRFNKGIENYKKYVNEFGNGRVSAKYVNKNNFKLGGWVSKRRAEYYDHQLSKDKIKKLESLKDWDWNPSKSRFNEGIENLKKYINEFGNGMVHQTYISKNNFRLGRWVSERRRDYRNGLISKENIKELESLDGWIWSINKKK